jgi:hypothetical protein
MNWADYQKLIDQLETAYTKGQMHKVVEIKSGLWYNIANDLAGEYLSPAKGQQLLIRIDNLTANPPTQGVGQVK